MMTEIQRCTAKAPVPSLNENRRGRECFLDESGEPSDRAGPDLTTAEPIEDVISRLKRARSTFPMEFIQACRDSGISLHVMYWKDGTKEFRVGYACDVQEDIRRARGDALEAILRSTDRRRESVVEVVEWLGWFVDNRPFASIEEAADQYLAIGGRILADPDGGCTEALSFDPQVPDLEFREGYPRRRVLHRYGATLRQKGAREQMAELVKAKGAFRPGCGWYVLEAPRQSRESGS